MFFFSNLAAALILHMCPHFPFSSHGLLSNLSLSSLSIRRFSCPPVHTTVTSPVLCFLLSLFPSLVVREIFYMLFALQDFPLPLLPILFCTAPFPCSSLISPSLPTVCVLPFYSAHLPYYTVPHLNLSWAHNCTT